MSSFVLSVILSVIYLAHPKFVEIINLKVTDIILGSAKAVPRPYDIITIAIDDKSVEKYGQWPWPRYLIGQLLQKISQDGAKVIGIDIIFAERDRTSPRLLQEHAAKNFGYPVDTSKIPAQYQDHDAYLATVLHQGPYVLSYTFLFNKTIPEQQCPLHPIDLIAYTRDEAAPLARLYEAKGLICNYAELAEAAAGAGFLNGNPDVDGVLRRLPLVIKYDGQFYPSFALAVMLELDQHTKELVTLSESNLSSMLSLADHHIPVDERGNFLLGPFREDKTSQYSATAVLTDQLEPGIFKDKIVLVGLTAAGLAQQYPTPLARRSSSLDIYRHSLDSLLAARHTIRTGLFAFLEVLVGLLLCFNLTLCVAYLRTGWALFFCMLGSCMSWLAAMVIYQVSGWLFSPLLPTVSAIFSSCLLLTLRFHYYQQQAKAENMDTALLLQSSETSLQSILQTIPDIVFRLDANGNITFVSPAITKYSKSPEALLGRHIFELVTPEDLDKAQYRLNERRTGERATVDLEICLLLTKEPLDPSTAGRHFSLSAEGIYRQQDDGARQFMGTQGIIKDITDKKRLEQQLIQAQKMEVIGRLAAGIAHDLNNILSGIVSYPDLLLLEIPQEDPLYKKIQIIQKSGAKAAVIVQDLLTLARRNITINETCNLNSIITDYLHSVEFDLVKKRHGNTVLTTLLQSDLHNIQGSTAHLSKVIMNILHNGLEAMPAGGTITIETVNVTFDAPVAGYETIPAGDYVCTSVTDSGVGIPASDLARIFEPFYTKKSMHFSGTGLGMTVVWATIKDHHGYVDISSREGEGTTFRFYLPVSRLNIVNRQERIAIDDYNGKETILVVDDIQEQLDIAENMLLRLGYTVYTAKSGIQALDILHRQPVNLVILDMIMPGGLDGLDTYREIIKLYPRQKALITSGFSESSRVKKLLRLGAGEYVQKPYTLEKLAMAVRKELDK